MPSYVDSTLLVIAAIAAVLLSAVQIAVFIVYLHQRTRAFSVKDRAIYPRYEPPEGVSPLQAATLLPKGRHGVAGELLELAVLGAIRIVALTRGAGRGTRWGIELAHPLPHSLPGQAGTVLTTFFPSPSAPLVELDRVDPATRRRLRTLVRDIREDPIMSSSANTGVMMLFPAFMAVLALGGNVPLGLWIIRNLPEPFDVLLALLCWAAGALQLLGIRRIHGARRPTEHGRAVLEHLEGLRMFMTIAEADRLRMLQAPATAHRDPHAAGQLLHLYERLLPYAAVFGILAEWGDLVRGLSLAAGQGEPNWCTGADGGLPDTGLGSFGGSLDSFSNSLESSGADSNGDGGLGGDGGGDGGGGGD